MRRAPASVAPEVAVLRPLLALLLGLAAAAALHLWGPVVGPLHLTLPAGLAHWLSPAGDRDLVLGQPAALWLLPLALLPYLVVVARRSLVDLPGWQVALQGLVRLLVLAALALALAVPTLQSPRRGKTVVLAVDVSASVDDGQLAVARQQVQDALRSVAAETGEREDRTRLRLLSYAATARALPLPADLDPTAVDLSREPGGGLASDHAGALRLAEALLDPDTEGRVVLISDGAGSVAERADLAATVRELQARGLTVHTRSAPPAARGDVLVEALHLPAYLPEGLRCASKTGSLPGVRHDIAVIESGDALSLIHI